MIVRTLVVLSVLITECIRYVPAQPTPAAQQRADYRPCLSESLVVGGGPGAGEAFDSIVGEMAADRAL